MEINREILEKVFDTAINSMNFASGFLDHDEVAALRNVAMLLQVNPDIATPRNFQPWKYDHPDK